MNNQQKGAERDFQAVKILTEWGVLDITQLQILLYPSYRVAQRRLSKLVADKRIKRCTQTAPYSYYVVQHPDIIHRLKENWIRLYIVKSLRSWERIIKYDYQSIVVLNTVTNVSKETLLIDLKTPSIESIKEGFKCER